MTRIMIVDDEWEILQTLRFIFELEQFEVVTASNGRECLNQMARAKPDVILSDIMMPLMSGVELTRTIRGNPGWADIPVIVMSAGLEPDGPRSWDAFVTKPFEFDHLLHLIGTLLTKPDRLADVPP